MNIYIGWLFKLIPLIMGLMCIALGGFVLESSGQSEYFVAGHVLISLAAEGAILLTAEGEILFGEAPRGKLVNAVGAGDSMVGGFVAGWVKTGNYREALQWGVAAGSASAFCETLATGEEIRRLYDETINIIREDC